MNVGVYLGMGNSSARRAFAALALAALAILTFRAVCDAYEFAHNQGQAAEFCCPALGANTPVPPATSAISTGDERGAPDPGILAALVPFAVPHRLHWLPGGVFPPLALGSYPRRSARLLR